FSAVMESRHHDDIVPEGLERFQNRGKLETGAFLFGSPLLHDRSHWNVDEAELRDWVRRRFRQRSLSRNHRLQEGQRHCDTCTSKESAAGQVLLRDEHGMSPYLVSAPGGFTQKVVVSDPLARCARFSLLTRGR